MDLSPLTKAARTLLTLTACLAVASVAAADGDAVLMSAQEIRNTESPLPVDSILSSGQPDAMVLDRLATAGYAAVIDLRGSNEDRGFDEEAEVQRRGLRYFSLAIEGPDAVNYENAARLDQLLTSLSGPVLVHCGSGNRVGALMALRASQAGASLDEALEKGHRAGMRSLTSVVTTKIIDETGEEQDQ